ncbi:MAG: transglycosylase domain-containing protein, partial [Helicobacteraceae bacterium]|nr:transglycosylase domain-containing protein [Helicobacteraceae bacterium]
MQRVKNVLFAVCVVLPALLITLDNLFPLPLKEARMARVVLADDGTPLWRFADSNGIWRFPVTIDEVSPYYIDALLAYEDRYFYNHFGVNPVKLSLKLDSRMELPKVREAS